MLLSSARDCGKRAIERALLASTSTSPTFLRSLSTSSSSTSSSSVLRVASFGHDLVPYSEGLRLQEAIAEARKAGALKEDVALSLQHSPVYTLGKRARPATDLLSTAAAVAARARSAAEVAASPRGGQATWHGPGQAVLYPIIMLKGGNNNKIGGVRRYMGELEAALVAVAARLGVRGARAGSGSGSPGAWVDVPAFEEEEGEDLDRDDGDDDGDEKQQQQQQQQSLKIGAVGVRVSGGVATHGAALNVSPDLSAFAGIVPCGDELAAPTSVELELERERERERKRERRRQRLLREEKEDLGPPPCSPEDFELDVSRVGLELAEELARRLRYARTERVGVGELKEELSRLGFL